MSMTNLERWDMAMQQPFINAKSVRNAFKSGFRPAWIEMTAKPSEFVAIVNR